MSATDRRENKIFGTEKIVLKLFLELQTPSSVQTRLILSSVPS